MISITVLEEFTNFGFFSDLFAVLIVEICRHLGSMIFAAILSFFWSLIARFSHRKPPPYKSTVEIMRSLRGVRHLSILDLLMTFSWYGPNKLHSSNYHRLSGICGSSVSNLEIDQCIGSRLKGLGDLTGVLNSHLHKLSIQSYYLIHFFALQDDTETSPIAMPSLIRPTLELAKDILTDQAQLLECIQRNIECIERINVKSSSHRRALVLLHETLHFVQGVHSSLEDCRQSLRLYPWGLHFANEIANSSGRSRFKAELARGLGIIIAKNLDSHSQLATGLDMHDEAFLQM
ncbi:hypothetical protein MJO29_014772 [Puccinia striiformis f. sp. tritici]|uniref:Uncharacterized protein n=2 Tax=Puccinia striiformis TaxID=27350 RepID=A0A0L0VGQ7_9BASI|nr:hypothetical protein MJO29_014772 [Puccinia striiformis f. sp. tritici]KAI9621543.1 hypothetical protein KEM48_007676 [Puccinia striiformis f. sp. tritici PST-130]KNE98438.1 hypothetical protein PSTG_08352 [Puccinia striiformis f. sp. tritici PST-78]POV95564.1 hypothetical protein PSHT_15606 [Puccinia striiformis]